MRKKTSLAITFFLVVILFIASCKKDDIKRQDQPAEISTAAKNNAEQGHLKQAKTFSSDVLLRWIDFQLTLYKTNAATMGGIAGIRFGAWTGIAVYESVVPGMPSYQSLVGQIGELPELPKTLPGHAYHWNASLNASLAYLTTNLFPAPAGQKAVQDQAIKDFSDGLYNEFLNQGASAELLNRSAGFGAGVATKIVEWANGYTKYYPSDFLTYPNLNPPIGTEDNFDIGTGRWVRTASANAALPYWGHTRLLVPGSLNGIQANSPFTYSTTPGSPFRNMVEAIYSDSYNPHGLSLADRRAIATYYAFPGFGSGHYLSLTKQVLAKANPTLDISALILAQTGIAAEDAGVGCVQVKYANYVVRPQTFIRKVLLYTNPDLTPWLPPIGQPNHPEYPSGHSTLAGAVAQVLTSHFGDNFSFTDRSFVNFTPSVAAREHSSFTAMANEIGDSRVYGQIHYSKSCEDGNALGRKVAQNVLNTVKFKKD